MSVTVNLRHVAKDIKPGIEVLKDMLQDANLVFDPMGFTVTALDPEKMVLVQASFCSMEVYSITGGTQTIVGVYMPFLFKTVHYAKDTDLIAMRVENDVLTVQVLDPETLFIKSESKIPSAIIPVEHAESVAEDLASWSTYNSKGVWRSAREVAAVEKTVRLMANEDTQSVELVTQHAMGDYRSDLTRHKESGALKTVDIFFYINVLTKFCKQRIGQDVGFFLKPGSPLRLRACNDVVDMLLTVALIEH